MKHISEHLQRHKQMLVERDEQTLTKLYDALERQHDQIVELRQLCERAIEKLELIEDTII